MNRNLMRQELHAHARTTEAICREMRDSEESIAKAAASFNINPNRFLLGLNT